MCVNLSSTLLPLQLTGDWQRDNIATVTNKRKILSVEGKVKVILEFGLVNSTIQIIWEYRNKIISVFERNGSSTQRFRKPERSDVDETPLEWFKVREK